MRIDDGRKHAPNLERLLGDTRVTKIFHYARFDIAILYERFGITA